MTLKTIENKIIQGADINIEDLLFLLEIEDPLELAKMYTFADALNTIVNHNVVSFVLNRNVNYTNICELRCAFCAYYCSDPTAMYTLTSDDVADRIQHLAISEVCIQGGLNSAVSFNDVVAIVERIKSLRPDIHIHGFSPMEIYYYAQRENLSHENILQTLKQKGLGSLCGTAAEILDDNLRNQICPRKLSTDEWCAVIKCAHRLGIPSSATILFGHIEEYAHIAQHFMIIREIQKETKMFTEFIPLPFMPYKTSLGKKFALDFIGLEKTKKIIACARIFFYRYIRNIQTSWVKLGLEGALECLCVGANDLGGTLYEENITRSAGGTHGQFISQERFVEEICRIDKKPFVRDTVYSFQKENISV